MKTGFKYGNFLVILLCWAIPCFAQKNAIEERDSLMQLLPLAKHDTNRIAILRKIAITYNAHNHEKASQYFNQAMDIAKRLNNVQLVAGLMVDIGYMYSQTGQSAKSIQILQEAIRLSDPKKSKYIIPLAQEFIALALQSQGDLENALPYAKLCYDFYNEKYKKEGNDGNGGPNSLMEGVTGSNMTLGSIYLDLNELDSAQYYLDIAYQLLKKTKNNNRYFTAFIPKSLATVYLKRQQTKQAKPYLDDALSKATLYSDTANLALVWTPLVMYYEQINKPDSAILFAQKAVEAGMKVRRYDAVLPSSQYLKKYFEKRKNIEKALYYSNIVLAAQDSLNGKEKVKQAQRLLYEELQNNQAIAQIKADNQNRFIRYGLGVSVLFLLLVIAILWLNYNRKQRENKNLGDKIKLQESVFAQKLAETEMAALRAQMNPHFIFNCLNSIKLFTLENDSATASEYLSKFSRLIRLVLENSRSEKITLENELETLSLYMDMEVMRFANKVKYTIDIDTDIEQRFIEIPPLLLQPYVENAIWHGLMHRDEGGTIHIRITQPHEDLLQVVITDNGIGRREAAKLKSKSVTKQKSLGMKMTTERIELINQKFQNQTQVQVIDLENTEGVATGTKVIVEIPI